MRNYETRLKSLENEMFGTDGDKVVIFDLIKDPPIFTYNYKIYELSEEEISKIDDKSLKKIMIKRGLIKKNDNKMFVIIRTYRGKFYEIDMQNDNCPGIVR